MKFATNKAIGLDYKCVLVYVGFNDGMKLYFVEKDR